MMPHLLRSSLAIAVAASAFAAAAQGTSSAQRATVAPPAAAGNAAASQGTSRPADYKLGPGDSIKVQVYQNPDLSVEARVSESGVVNYPLIGAVQLGGLSISEAEARIAQALQQGNILKAPQVNINLLQVRGSQVAVLGQVQKPGRFPLETTNVRVSEMIAAAGGVAPTGDDVVVVSGTRNGQPFRKSIDLNGLFSGRSDDDIVLQSGDSLFVGKAPTFYIYGEAQRPGTYRVERGMTVQQAIAQGGGITPRGSESRLRLNRTQPDGSVVQMTPRLSDPVQPGDVLFVRESIF
jgi:polysaccharide biosynthesis/export protein